jgi:beta-lactamase class C
MYFLFDAYAQNGSFLQHQIERAIIYENRYDSLKTTGIIIGCIDHDSTWIFPFGRISKATNQQPDASTYFEIGSLTQTFTAANIQFLVHQGILHDDSVVNVYLRPEHRFAAGNKITLLDLMTHRSGLPKFLDSEYFGDGQGQDKEQPYAHYTEGGFFNFLQKHDTIDAHGAQYLFSNLNYVLLGQILDDINEETWWKPFVVNKSDIALAQGYNLAGQAVEPWQIAPIFMPAIGGCTNMTQVLGFVKWQLNIDSLDRNGLLKDTQASLFPTKINKYTFVAKGWHIFKAKKRLPICMSSGATSGHSAVVVFVPETKTSIVILSNSRAIQGTLAMSILRVLNNNWKRRG